MQLSKNSGTNTNYYYCTEKNQLHTHKMGNKWLGNSSAENDMWLAVHHKLNMNQRWCHSFLEKKSTIKLGCIKLSHYSMLIRPHFKKWATGEIPKRATTDRNQRPRNCGM